MPSDDQNPDAGSQGGLFESLKTLALTLVAMGRTRLELLSNDIEEEREWLTAMLTWTLVALFCAALAVVLATLLLIVVFWENYRIPVLCILVVLFFLAAALAWRTVRNMANAKPRLFAASLAELSKDGEQLGTPHE